MHTLAVRKTSIKQKTNLRRKRELKVKTKKIANSFKYAGEGLISAFKREKNYLSFLKFRDYWKGTILVKKKAFEFYVQASTNEYAVIYVKQKEATISQYVTETIITLRWYLVNNIIDDLKNSVSNEPETDNSETLEMVMAYLGLTHIFSKNLGRVLSRYN